MDEGYERVNATKIFNQDLLTLQKYLSDMEYAELVRKYR
jgi:hypothetical protein